MSFLPPPTKSQSTYIPYEDDEVDPIQMPSDEDPVDNEGRAIGEQPVVEIHENSESNSLLFILFILFYFYT